MRSKVSEAVRKGFNESTTSCSEGYIQEAIEEALYRIMDAKGDSKLIAYYLEELTKAHANYVYNTLTNYDISTIAYKRGVKRNEEQSK